MNNQNELCIEKPNISEKGSSTTTTEQNNVFQLNIGDSHVCTHFGEILQGQFIVDNSIKRALVTLPCPAYHSRAVFVAKPDSDLTVEPEKCQKALKAAELTLDRINRSNWGGRLVLQSNIPESIGAGSSSGDVVATIKSVSNAFGVCLPNEEIGKLAVSAETASDSIMFDNGDAVLFAQRDGILLRTLGPLPRIRVLGVIDGERVDTLSYPPAKYNDIEIHDFMVLLEKLHSSIKSGDPHGVAAVATASASINQKFLPKPSFNKFLKLVPAVGAMGIAVSHSGSACAFLFDGAKRETTQRINNLINRLSDMGKTEFLNFEPNYPSQINCKERTLHETPR